MASRPTATWLIAFGALVLLASRAMAQVPANSNLNYPSPEGLYAEGSPPFSDAQPSKSHDLWPFAPGHVGADAQWFAPARTSGYGNGPRPNIGHFFSYERLFWSLGKAQTAVVGSETADPPATNGIIAPLTVPAFNSLDTGKFTANGGWGNRWELGYIDNDNYGWMASILDHVQQSQYHIDRDVQMQFDDPGGLLTATVLDDGTLDVIGKMAVQFDETTQQQITTINGVDLTRFYRPPRGHQGGYFDVLYGVRWLQLADAYIFTGTNFEDSGVINPLADSIWSNVVQNNLVGPEIGIRWFKQRSRWVTSVDARFLAAANFQTVKMRTELGNEYAQFVNSNNLVDGVIVAREFLGLGTDQHAFATTFAPAGELRVNVSFNVTSKVAVKVNYTGLIIGNISRANNRIDYSQDRLVTILDNNIRQLFFSNGLGFGVEINR